MFRITPTQKILSYIKQIVQLYQVQTSICAKLESVGDEPIKGLPELGTNAICLLQDFMVGAFNAYGM